MSKPTKSRGIVLPESAKRLPPKRFFSPPGIICHTYNVSQPQVQLEKDSVYRISEMVSAHVIDMKDKAIIEAIIDWAKENKVTELTLLDKTSVRSMLNREVPKRLYFEDESVYRCGSCGIHVHAGDNYCACCGQKLREVDHE